MRYYLHFSRAKNKRKNKTSVKKERIFWVKNVHIEKRKPTGLLHRTRRSFHRKIQIYEVHKKGFARITLRRHTWSAFKTAHLNSASRYLFISQVRDRQIFEENIRHFQNIILFGRKIHACNWIIEYITAST